MINVKEATTLALAEAKAKKYNKVALLSENDDSFVFEAYKDPEPKEIEYVGLPLRIIVDKNLGNTIAIRTMKY